jgi:hypothetical protein
MSGEQRWSKPGAEEVPGADDMTTAPDSATVPARDGAATPQQADPGGYPHPPSHKVPANPADPAHLAQEVPDRGADNPRPDRGSADPDS